MLESITKEELQELCQEVLVSASKEIKRYKTENLTSEQLECFLLSILLRKLRSKLNQDPETLAASPLNKENRQIYVSAISELLDERAKFDYRKVIKTELLAKAQGSWVDQIIKVFKS